MDDIESLEIMLEDMRSFDPKMYRQARKLVNDALANDINGEWLPRTLVVAVAYSYEKNYSSYERD